MFYIKGLIKACTYSLDGLKEGFQNHKHFRLAIALTLVLSPVAIFIGDNQTDRAFLLFVLLLIPIFELVNSALEITINRIGLEQNPLSKNAKDLASAAVSLSIVNAAVVWSLLIFG